MAGTMISRGNVLYEIVAYLPTISWSSATLSSTTSELTCTIPGLQLGDAPYLTLANSAMPTNLSYTNIRVSAANTLAVTWVAAAGGITIPTGPWILDVVRPEVTNAALPNNAT